MVLDPFMGSGQTALAALKAGRRYVGYDIDATMSSWLTGVSGFFWPNNGQHADFTEKTQVMEG